ncbi:MAG: hypothetical protein H0U10_07850 [Chloroflexia bacterium]|nr:hypothetical protein [Chloroflexia bacterium]
MNALALIDVVQQGRPLFGAALIVAGVWLLWRGLRGARGGHRGLLRGTEPALARAEGWRVAVLGVVVGGLGVAALTSSPLLFYLFLGIGIVELWEASFVIAVWRHGDARGGAVRNA